MKADIWLDRRLSRVDRTVREACIGLIDDVERDTLEPLTTVLNKAADRFDALSAEVAASLKDDAEGFPPTPDRLVKVERMFRNTFLEEIIRPVEAHLGSSVIGASIAARGEAAQATVDALMRKLPKTIRRAEPADLYRGAPGDSIATRARKAWIRAGRRLGGGAEDAKQVVPFRTLMKYHVWTRASGLLAGLCEDLQQAAAVPVARLEVAAQTALKEVPKLEGELDPTMFLVPEAFRSLAPDRDTITSGEINPGAGRDEFLRKINGIGEQLRAAAGAAVGTLPREDLDRALDLIGEALTRDVAVSDTFQLKLRRRNSAAEGDRPADRCRARGERWSDWHREALARGSELRTLLEFGAEIDEIEATVVREVLSDAVLDWMARCREAVEVLKRGEAAAAAALAGNGQDQSSAMADYIRTCMVDTAGYFAAELITPGSPGGAVRAAASKAIETLFEEIHSVPETFVLHPLPDADAQVIDPDVDVLVLRLRQALEQSFDALVVERLRKAPDSIAETLDASHAGVKSAAEVFDYNLATAIEELGETDSAAMHDEAVVDPDDEQNVDRARDLVANGFAATADAISLLEKDLEGPTAAFIGDWISSFGAAWAVILERAKSSTALGERGAAVGSQITSGLKTGLRGGHARARKSVETNRERLGRWRRRLNRLIRRGQKAVTSPDATGQGAFPTLAAVRDLARIVEDLPVVYRRLFGFTSVTGGLLVGREPAIVAASRHYGAWKRGLTNPLLITGAPGSGKTSLMRHLKEVTLKEIEPKLITLTEALRTEAEVVGLLADAAGVDAPAERTFAALAEAVMELPKDPRRVCMIDNLEYLLLRTVGGSLLVKRAITFMSRTDTRVLWIISVNGYAWQFIERTESAAAALVIRLKIDLLDRKQLETAIMGRHARSGLPIQFELGRKPSAWLRRRVRRATSEQKKQAILRNDYFDRLYRVSLGDFTLAVFYWLRSAEFDHGERILRMRPIRTLDFGYLASLSRDQAFALKALLEHRALTVEDHQAVFDSTYQRSMEIFESLGNAYLIRPAGIRTLREAVAFETMVDELPYSVGMLMRGPVGQVLRHRHIAY